MRAVVCREFGGFDKLRIEEIPEPEMIPAGVRIRVEAAGANFADSLMVGGTYQRKPPFPFVPGLPVAGTVIEVADGVTRFRPGDRVFAALDHGAYAEVAVAPADNTFHFPDDMDFATAIAFPFSYGTSYGSIVWKGRLQPGETLLVHGAAGAVGLAAVEIGKALGARVIATAGSPEKLQVARDHGADIVIDYTAGTFREAVLEATGGRGADVVFDPVGGEVFDQSLRCTAPEGRILVIGFAGGTVPQIPANILLVKNITVVGFFWAHFRKNHQDWVEAGLARMFDWVREGKLNPVISHRFPLEQFKEAMDTILARKSIGKVVLLPRETADENRGA